MELFREAFSGDFPEWGVGAEGLILRGRRVGIGFSTIYHLIEKGEEAVGGMTG